MAKPWSRDFKTVAGLGYDACIPAQRGGAEEVAVHIARPTEDAVLKMMMFQAGNGVRHMIFPGQKWLLPESLSISFDPHCS